MTKRTPASIADLEICAAGQTVRCQGRETRLPDLSFRLLALLSEAAPEVVSFEAIERGVWNAHTSKETIKQRAKMLRDSLADLGVAGGGIQSVRNVGYRLTRNLDVYEPPRGGRAASRTRVFLIVAGALAVGLCALVIYLTQSGASAAAPSLSVRADAAPGPGSEAAAWSKAQQALITGLTKATSTPVTAADRGRPADLVVAMDRVSDGASDALALELLEPETGVVLWSVTYELDQDGYEKPISAFVPAVQAQFDALGLRPQGRDLTSDAWRRAWQLYASASSAAVKGDEADLVAARSRLDAAVRLRPGFTLARSLRARIDARLVTDYGRDRRLALTALVEAQALVDAHPDAPEFRRTLATAQIATGALRPALDNLERAQRNLPFLRGEVVALRRRLDLEGDASPS